MRPKADVRSRIFSAAQKEFAAHGLAGARIDRIATSADASKERLYAYFPSKNDLFRAVVDGNVTEFDRSVALEPMNVSGFVGTAFDYAHKHPEVPRILAWARLEGHEHSLSVRRGRDRKLTALRKAQDLGLIDSSLAAEELLPLLLGLAQVWLYAPRINRPDTSDPQRQARRAAAVAAAGRLVQQCNTPLLR